VAVVDEGRVGEASRTRQRCWFDEGKGVARPRWW
jgi:hypothetical protein